MASGTIALTRTGSGYLTGQILWTSTANGSAANTSTVTASLQIQRSALNATTGTFKGTFTVGSTSKTISWYGTLPSKEWVTIETITVTVSHSAEGNGSCYLYAIVNGPTQTTMEGTYVSGSSTVTLDWIPRFASIVSVTDFTDEGNPVITYSNPAGTVIEALQACISLDGKSASIPYKDVPKTGTSYTFPLTEAERNTLRAAAANSKTLTVTVYLKSVIGGSTSIPGKNAKMSVVNDTPTLSITVTDTNAATKKLTGNAAILVALHSTASVSIQAAAKKYATIKSQVVEHGSARLTGNGTLSPVTNNPIRLTVTDSRGNTAAQYASNTIVPYIDPTCIIGNQLPQTDGSFELVATGRFYNGTFGAVTNTLTLQYRYKAMGRSYPDQWTTFDTLAKSGNAYTATAHLTGLDYQTVYTFQVRAIDAIHTAGVYAAEKSVISEPVFDWGQEDFWFNVPVNLKEGCEILKNGSLAYAPVGYGYDGKTLPSINGNDSELSAMLSSMQNHSAKQFRFSGGDPTFSGLGWFYGTVFKTDNSYATVHAYNYYNNTTVRRSFLAGLWQPWEWANPQMKLGVEYRTTEHYLNKPVYAKLVNCGNGPNNSQKLIEHGISNAMVIDFGGYMEYNGTMVSIPWLTASRLSADSTRIAIETTANYSLYTAYVWIKYYKTTD